MRHKIHARQGNTGWEDWIEADSVKEAVEKIIDEIKINPYNRKYNEFEIYDEDGVILYEGEWWHLDMVNEEDGESEEWVLEQNAATETEIAKILHEGE